MWHNISIKWLCIIYFGNITQNPYLFQYLSNEQNEQNGQNGPNGPNGHNGHNGLHGLNRQNGQNGQNGQKLWVTKFTK